MHRLTNKVVVTGDSIGSGLTAVRGLMNSVIWRLIKLGILKEDLDYHLVRASMVIIFLFFGYQKWFDYEAQVLIPYISNGPLIFWMYPAFGIRGASWFLGVSEWLICALFFSGFWNKKLRNPWGARLVCYIHQYPHYYSIHALWLGCVCRRVPRNGWQCSFFDEGLGAFGCINLFTKTRCDKVSLCRRARN